MTPLEEKVARVIADEIGPTYDDAYEDKRDWMADRGLRHDLNAPHKCDFRYAAQAAIAVVMAAMREPTPGMLDEAALPLPVIDDGEFYPTIKNMRDDAASTWHVMLAEFERNALGKPAA